MTFLLVEDDPYDVFFVEREFKQASVNAILRVVRDGVEAIDYLAGRGDRGNRENHPLPDVILLDWELPRMGGREFLQWLRCESPARQRSIPVVILCCSALHAEELAKADDGGGSLHLIKPLVWHQFEQQLQTVGISVSAPAAPPRNEFRRCGPA